MTITPLPHHAAAPVATPAWRRALLSWPLGRVLVMAIAMAGAAVLLYSPTLNWFHDLRHSSVISGYVQQAVGGRTPAEVARQLDAAHAYNAALPTGALRDPYATDAGADASSARYRDTLDLGPGGLMGVLSIPTIGVNLPIYHGTSAQTLDTGIGHLYGSALPVGGAGTHAVLTGHSGVVGDELLTGLHRVKLGDTFTVRVLDETLTYRVDQIKTVLPTQLDDLAPVPGKDYVTLLTCTPIGVNSHRLLVRGVRVETPSAGAGGQVLRDAVRLPFPWWAVGAAGALVLGGVVTAPLAATPRRRDRS